MEDTTKQTEPNAGPVTQTTVAESEEHPWRFWLIVLLVAAAASALAVLYQTGAFSSSFPPSGNRIIFIDQRLIVKKLMSKVTAETPPKDVQAIAYQFSRVIREDTAKYLAKGDVVFYSDRDARFPDSANVSEKVYQQVLQKLPRSVR